MFQIIDVIIHHDRGLTYDPKIVIHKKRMCDPQFVPPRSWSTKNECVIHKLCDPQITHLWSKIWSEKWSVFWILFLIEFLHIISTTNLWISFWIVFWILFWDNFGQCFWIVFWIVFLDCVFDSFLDSVFGACFGSWCRQDPEMSVGSLYAANSVGAKPLLLLDLSSAQCSIRFFHSSLQPGAVIVRKHYPLARSLCFFVFFRGSFLHVFQPIGLRKEALSLWIRCLWAPGWCDPYANPDKSFVTPVCDFGVVPPNT